MNKKMLIALGASVCLSTAAFAADDANSTNTTTSTPVVAPSTSNRDAMPTKPEADKADQAKSNDKTAEGKCAGGKCSAGNCSGASKK